MRDHERLLLPSFPMPSLRRGQSVKVRTGQGWMNAKVEERTRSRVTVRVGQRQNFVNVWDARNVYACKTD